MKRSKHSFSRRQTLCALAGAALAGCSANPPRPGAQRQPDAELILCGGDEVLILSLGEGRDPRKAWSWRADDCPEIPEALRPRFKTTDDCKPVAGGRSILISSSSGAVALVDREPRRARFWAPVVNAHSIEALPKGRIAAAASTGTAPGANRIIIFDIASMRELGSDELVSAHGVVWDEARQLLWALGKQELRAYRIGEGTAGDPLLSRQFLLELPETGGHDLSAVPGTPALFISTGNQCWLFNRDTRKLKPHDSLGDVPRIKSYSVHSSTGQVCYVQAEGSDWWAENLHFQRPAGVLRLAGQRLYKARWATPPAAPAPPGNRG